MEGWIDCKNCHNRFRAFIQFCPRCGSQNPHYGSKHAPDSLKKRIGKKSIIITAVSVFVIVTCVVLALGEFSKNFYHINNSSNPNLPNGLYIAKPIPRELEQRPNFTADLVQYTLNKINEDRSKFNLPPIQLSHNEAAQIQAEDILKARDISHWTTDGMKPYMIYSIYDGSGGLSQNVAVESK